MQSKRYVERTTRIWHDRDIVRSWSRGTALLISASNEEPLFSRAAISAFISRRVCLDLCGVPDCGDRTPMHSTNN